eukprot:TRINITY_DN17790_c2_g3_i1.p1 TRINITY_DN17790_c2_g3~~TRINITY_DN17790_c2_g3_i1.p1  ORF type:complete len:166 (-),score=11.90 TRINITY_DN17790_c2_g3_i1:23-520(-)
MQLRILKSILILGLCIKQYDQLGNLVDTIAKQSRLSTLIEAMTGATLIKTLSDPELDYTLFAPTNPAFEFILEVLGLTFEELIADKETLSSIILYHIVPQRILQWQFMDGSELVTLGGGNITIFFGRDSKEVEIEGVGNVANVITPNVNAGKSVVHVIDEVLIPF